MPMLSSNQLVATKRVEFLIRYRSDINEQMRITYNNETYKIEAILNADSRKAFQKSPKKSPKNPPQLRITALSKTRMGPLRQYCWTRGQ